MSKRKDIRDAIITELLDANNSTGIVAAKAYKANSGNVYAMVHTDESDNIEIEGSQFFWERITVIIALFGRTLEDVEDAGDVVQTLFYKTTPLANLASAATVTNATWIRTSPNPDHPGGVHRLDVTYTMDYRNTYTV